MSNYTSEEDFGSLLPGSRQALLSPRRLAPRGFSISRRKTQRSADVNFSFCKEFAEVPENPGKRPPFRAFHHHGAAALSLQTARRIRPPITPRRSLERPNPKRPTRQAPDRQAPNPPSTRRQTADWVTNPAPRAPRQTRSAPDSPRLADPGVSRHQAPAGAAPPVRCARGLAECTMEETSGHRPRISLNFPPRLPILAR